MAAKKRKQVILTASDEGRMLPHAEVRLQNFVRSADGSVTCRLSDANGPADCIVTIDAQSWDQAVRLMRASIVASALADR